MHDDDEAAVTAALQGAALPDTPETRTAWWAGWRAGYDTCASDRDAMEYQ